METMSTEDRIIIEEAAALDAAILRAARAHAAVDAGTARDATAYNAELAARLEATAREYIYHARRFHLAALYAQSEGEDEETVNAGYAAARAAETFAATARAAADALANG